MKLHTCKKGKKMKQSIYTIMDRIAGISAVVQITCDEVAMRYFKNAFDVNENFKMNAADFVGVKLANIDTQTGIIEPDYKEMLDCYEYLENKKGDKKENG